MRTADWALRVGGLEGLQEALELEGSAAWHSTAYEARPFLLAASYLRHPRKMLIVAASYDRALTWQAKLGLAGVAQGMICQLPSGTSALFEDATPEHIALSDRLGALRALTEDKPWIVVTSPQAVLERTLPKDVLCDAFIHLAPGEEIDPESLLRKLVDLGYEHQEPVRIPGQFSQRGGILDIYATGHDLPMRIELFGDQIESIRRFDPNTQRSVAPVPELNLTPSRETLYSGHSDFRELLLPSLEREMAGLSDEAAQRLEELVNEDIEALQQKVYFDRLDLYRPLLHPDSGCAIDLLEAKDLLVLDEPLELESIAARAEEELAQALDARAERGEILASPATDFMIPPEHLSSHALTLSMTSMNALPEWLHVDQDTDLQAISLEPYRGRSEALALTLKNYREQGFTLVFTSDQPNRAKTVLGQVEIFVETELPDSNPAGVPSKSPGLAGSAAYPGNAAPDFPNPERVVSFPFGAYLAQGNLGGGFVLPELKLALVTDAELFGVARLKLPQRRFMEGAPVATVLDLKPGDYVVHINFGIGVFRGLTKRTVDGVEKEFLFIEYQAPDKLFVPTEQLDRIQKYLNPGDAQPKLNKLSGTEWQRTIGKAKEEAKIFARDLVKLYAQRKQVQRPPYGSDTPFQAEMEDTFPWVETRSQLEAIRDTKVDMQEAFPMDRLVCGDVGFGKTEVAIRAAFKAVQSGRQVAILCPTTILSEQHFRNFSERLGPFGSKLGLINRFTHAHERAELIQQLKAGEVEVIVGTHALLGTGIEFKHLGLVVIDEEQKFGVKQKEMLKRLRTEVDVLTLSATPIPRTLSMALMDIRQMSLINDPPPGRLPIRTFVRPYATEVVREAILRELARGGQIFYVYNRVESIGHVAEKLRKLVPTARIGVGHGQMGEKELEPIMVGFIKGEIDVLLSTTIIENGIDISNANTLIVENADRLGLAQLYQLRGRVGRSDRQAYAYFLYSGVMDVTRAEPTVQEANLQAHGRRKRPTMTEGALARLQALQEFSTLGSGYSLAFRDLQIRGAGELLGAKQSGTMVTVGYELYTQMINEAVAVLKTSVDGELPSGVEIRDPLEELEPLPAFEVPVVALLPDSYIKDQAQRLYYYQQMMSSRSQQQLGEVEAEIEDRYGHLTPEVRNAFTVMSLRIRAEALGFEKLDARQGRIALSLEDRSSLPPRLFSMLGHLNRECYVSRDSFIWPFRGEPLLAIDRMIQGFEESLAELERDRASLGV